MNAKGTATLVGSIAIGLTLTLTAKSDNWPMLGRDATRNAVSPEKNPPVDWDVGKLDRKTGKWSGSKNVKWTAKLGSLAFGDPVVSDGLVWVGTNNGADHTDIKSVLKCFRESDGKLLYEYVSPRLPNRVHDNGWGGIGCSPLIERDRMWFTTNRCETVCLDIGPLKRGEGEPRIEWKCDMKKELGVFPRALLMGPARTCSVTSYKNLIYVVTGNGVDQAYVRVPAPKAPSLVCFNKVTGAVVWTDNSPGENILLGQLASPLIVEVDGQGQVVVPQGDGWLRSFDALTGELVWKFDMNLKSSKWIIGGRGTRNSLLATPVLYDQRVYIAGGQYPEHGEGLGRLCCIDPTKTGDISSQLAANAHGNLLPYRRIQAVDPDKGEKAVSNPNSGLVWEYTTFDRNGDKKTSFEETFHRTISNVAIKNDLLVAADFSGLFHCLNAKTGEIHWTCDQFARTWGSPLIVDDKAYVTDEDGDVAIFELSATDGEPLQEINMGGSIYTSPIFANGTLYFASRSHLFAMQADDDATGREKNPALSQEPGSWPQWRGPNRDNVSTETGLLKKWPKDGPPLLWRVKGIGHGIASVSVAGGRIFTLSDHEDDEYVVALDEQTGEHLWTRRLGKSVPQNRLMRWLSQRCPTVDDERLYAFTAAGELVCLQCRDGREMWRKNYLTDFGGKRGMWGYCDFPLVDGDRLICAPGGTYAAIVALNKLTGEPIWKTEIPKGDVAGYAATVVATVEGIRQYVVFLQSGLVGVSAEDGKVLWRHGGFSTSQNSFTPLIRDNEVFCASARYVEGIALLELGASEGRIHVTKSYYSNKLYLNNFQDTLVRVGEHVYGDARYGPICIQWKTGTPAWQQPRRRGRKMSSILFADGHLYVREADGVMKLVEANPREYLEKSTFTIPDHQPSIGATHPVIAGGRLYLRDNDNLFCYDVRNDALDHPRPEPRTIRLPVALDELSVRERRERSGPRSAFVPTPQDIVEKMLELAKIKKLDVVYDLGSGDGRIVITAAKKYGSRAVGYEIDKDLVELSRENAAKAKVEKLVAVHHQDLFKADLAEADVVALYLLPKQLEKLLPQLEKLKPGSRIVSHHFEIPGLKPDKTVQVQSRETGSKHTIHLWTVPLTSVKE